jgi:hypothetical protein
MFSKVFLAGSGTNPFPPRFAYMAAHFSPYGKGLSHLPEGLPEGSILLLDDSLPPTAHDPETVTEQLKELAERFSPVAILLDFQRPITTQLQIMAETIIKALPCPVGITEAYAKEFGCPVFLPPPPANKALGEHIGPWKKQGVYLEIAPEGLEITVTEAGSSEIPIFPVSGLHLEDKRLHCHYNVEVSEDKAVFTICRYKEDLARLVQEAEDFGVLGCVGLYGELIN